MHSPSMLHSHVLSIPDDIVQHITQNTLVFLNKRDLVSGYAAEKHITAIRESMLGLTKHLWVGSVLMSDEGGMNDFIEGLAGALKRR